MALINRQTLKNYFKKGGFATEKHFVDLIDSSLNVVDDGISIQRENGLKINPIGFSTKLISFSKSLRKNLQNLQLKWITLTLLDYLFKEKMIKV